MQVRGIERVALQVRDLDVAVALFSRLLGTAFQRHELQAEQGRPPLKLAFSPLGIELLQDDGAGDPEGLRSFHLRVETLAGVREAVISAGGQVLAEFRVGEMDHMITRVGAFRMVYVAYSGDDALAALAGRGQDTAQGTAGGRNDAD